VWLRFVTGRPLSALTIKFLTWLCTKLRARDKTALLLVWDNASWHRSYAVRRWLRTHNQRVKRDRHCIRIAPCLLPLKSPWFNPLEAHWVQGKRAVVEPARLLMGRDLME